MTDIDELAKKSSAILEDDYFAGKVKELRREALKKFENSRPDEQDAREEAYHSLRAINRLLTTLKRDQDNLKLAMAGKLRSKTE